MSRTRNIIEEIADIRRRRGFDSPITTLSTRLSALERTFAGHDQEDDELVRYFPVALVACMEGYFRLAIKDLVDAGDPYLSNAERTAHLLKLDFTLVRALLGKTITIGELVAHSVPISRLEHIEAALTDLLGASFLGKLRIVSDRWAHEVGGLPAQPILSAPEKVFADVAKTFELRHIICHELASAQDVDYAQVAALMESCTDFLKAADELISETLHPGAPLTQAGMNIAALETLARARTQLAVAVDKWQSRLTGEDLAAFESAQAKWESYCDAWSDFEAIEVKAGTMWPMVRAGAAEVLVRRRTEELRNYRRMEEGSGET